MQRELIKDLLAFNRLHLITSMVLLQVLKQPLKTSLLLASFQLEQAIS
jgi:hypothetical protein